MAKHSAKANDERGEPYGDGGREATEHGCELARGTPFVVNQQMVWLMRSLATIFMHPAAKYNFLQGNQ